MKQRLTFKLKQQGGRMLQGCVMLLMAIMLPALSFSQPPPPTGGTGGGSLPDSPLSVPFDNKLSLLLIAAGIVLAVAIMLKAKKKSDTHHPAN